MTRQLRKTPTPPSRASKFQDQGDSDRDQAEPNDGPEKVRESKARQRTRLRLIIAAETVMSMNGVEGATIQDITEEAQLATGTFYNHFKTKEDVARAVFSRQAEELGKTFDLLGSSVNDPARAIVFIQRTYIERALADPIWGRFIIHAEFSLRQNEKTFRDRARRDILRGIAAKRFDCENCIESAITITLSSMVAVTRQILEGRADKEAMYEMTELLLRMYGVSGNEATALARLPLPDVDNTTPSITG